DGKFAPNFCLFVSTSHSTSHFPLSRCNSLFAILVFLIDFILFICSKAACRQLRHLLRAVSRIFVGALFVFCVFFFFHSFYVLFILFLCSKSACRHLRLLLRARSRIFAGALVVFFVFYVEQSDESIELKSPSLILSLVAQTCDPNVDLNHLPKTNQRLVLSIFD